MSISERTPNPCSFSAARVFANFLAEQVTPELACRYGFRPADEDVAPAGLVTRANGNLTQKLTVKASRFSAAAEEKITKAGGKVEKIGA